MKPGLPLSKRGGWLLAGALVAALVTVVAGLRGFLWWPVETSPIDVQLVDIASIQLQPFPEGPSSLGWIHPPTSPPSEQLSQIEAAIRSPFPGQMSSPFGAGLAAT